MDWGTAEWDSDCDFKLPNYLFDESCRNKNAARKKKKRSRTSIGLKGSEGKFVRVQLTNNSDNATLTTTEGKFVRVQQTNNSDNSTLTTAVPSLQSNKQISSVGNDNVPKKIKLNNKYYKKNIFNETHNLVSCDATSMEEIPHQLKLNKKRKKKRRSKTDTHVHQATDDLNVFQESTDMHTEINESKELSNIKISAISRKKSKKMKASVVKIPLNNSIGSKNNVKKSVSTPEALDGNIVKSAATESKSLYKMEELKQYLKKHHLFIGTMKDEQISTNPLRERMIKKLQASHFRYLNEQLYNSKSDESMAYFRDNLTAFRAYHEGYQQQVAQWPLNPLNLIINSLKKKPSNTVIADFGCGEAHLAKSLPDHKVYSFDFVAACDLVIPCDMANTPLENGCVDIVVFCLSLMGSNLSQYILEANRVLKNGGMMMIAEVESRFENVETFIQDIKKMGFTNTWKDLSHKIFYFLYFKKVMLVTKSKKLPHITLKSCLYKKR